MSDTRLNVRKTYKLLINGAFLRSESGRSYEVASAQGAFLANVAQGSRKDIRDAVVGARAAQLNWWNASAYNRGQVIYRLAEMAESRRDELSEHVALSEGLGGKKAQATVSRSIDRIVWYAGWTDKIAQVFGGTNPVAGPFFNFSVPVPSGVVAVLADQRSSLEAFVDAVLAPIAVGNTVVCVASQLRPTPAVLLGEMTATSDFPNGVLNIITGLTEELARRC
jgi:acyl-CoA reductase-like NAD-dependent aldehyde dehydrogenase